MQARLSIVSSCAIAIFVLCIACFLMPSGVDCAYAAETVKAGAIIEGDQQASAAAADQPKTKKYSLTYKLRGGKLSGKQIDTYTIKSGVAKLPKAVRTGYTFLGWSVNKLSKKTVTSIPKGTKGNKKLYAIWRKNTYVAHRGIAGDGVRKNSLQAFENAAEKGFDYVETDVRFTRDNVAVLAHDDEIKVYKAGKDGKKKGKAFKIKISEVSYNKLQNAYVAARRTGKVVDRLVVKFDKKTNKLTVTTKQIRQNVSKFADFLDTCKSNGLIPYIEIKDGTKAQIKNLVKKVDKHHMTRKVKWASFDENVLNIVKKCHPKSDLVLLAFDVTKSRIIAAKSLSRTGGKVSIITHATELNKDDVNLCKNAKIPMGVWTLKNEKIASKYASKYDKYIDTFVIDKVKKTIV